MVTDARQLISRIVFRQTEGFSKFFIEIFATCLFPAIFPEVPCEIIDIDFISVFDLGKLFIGALRKLLVRVNREEALLVNSHLILFSRFQGLIIGSKISLLHMIWLAGSSHLTPLVCPIIEAVWQ